LLIEFILKIFFFDIIILIPIAKPNGIPYLLRLAEFISLAQHHQLLTQKIKPQTPKKKR